MKNREPTQFQSIDCEPEMLRPALPAETRPPDPPRQLPGAAAAEARLQSFGCEFADHSAETFPEPRQPWLMEALKKIDAHDRLARGWDSHDGLPLSAPAKQLALQALACLQRHALPVPGVVLGSNGSLHLEWHARGKELEIGFGEGSGFEYIKVDAEGTVEEGQEIAVTQERLCNLVEWLKAG